MLARPVSRSLRVADLVGLLLVVAGAACYARAFLGMRRLEHAKPLAKLEPGVNLFAALAEFSGYARLAYVGLGLVAAGIVVGIGSAMAWRHRRRAAAPADAPRADTPLAA